jgi:hypothetical protein
MFKGTALSVSGTLVAGKSLPQVVCAKDRLTDNVNKGKLQLVSLLSASE